MPLCFVDRIGASAEWNCFLCSLRYWRESQGLEMLPRKLGSINQYDYKLLKMQDGCSIQVEGQREDVCFCRQEEE